MPAYMLLQKVCVCILLQTVSACVLLSTPDIGMHSCYQHQALACILAMISICMHSGYKQHQHALCSKALLFACRCHTGMQEEECLQRVRGSVDLVLDTTYCQPQYIFPKQEEVQCHDTAHCTLQASRCMSTKACMPFTGSHLIVSKTQEGRGRVVAR